MSLREKVKALLSRHQEREEPTEIWTAARYARQRSEVEAQLQAKGSCLRLVEKQKVRSAAVRAPKLDKHARPGYGESFGRGWLRKPTKVKGMRQEAWHL